MLNALRNALCAVFVVFIGACGSNSTTAPGGQSNTPAPQIVTTSVKEALKGELYSQSLAATGGTAPLVWSLPTEPKEIPWLTIDSSSGALSGAPSEALALGKSFVVQVKDNDGRIDQKTFTLFVRECTSQDEGKSFSCHIPSDDACIEGTRTCTGGQLGECIAGGGSTSTDYCGSSCLTCGTSADTCSDGRCQCGTDDPCGKADTTKPDCCTEQTGSVCTNLQSDAKHCGQCDTACGKNAINVVPTCAGGNCVTPAPCQPGYARCPIGSNEPDCGTDTNNSQDNCGGCGSKCPAFTYDQHANSSCQGGQCQIACTDGAQNCDGQIVNGCECSQIPLDGGNMSCTASGKCAPQCPGANSVLCQIGGINSGALSCVSPQNYVKCNPNDPTTCRVNGTETKDGDGRKIKIDNCGRCDNTCNAPSGSRGRVECDRGSGTCTQFCDPIPLLDRALCNGQCVSLSLDRNNCGACGSICPATIPNGTAACLLGICSPSCNSPYANCDGSVANGCETQLHTNANCSACGDACWGNNVCTDVCTSWGGKEGDVCQNWVWQCVDPNGGGGGQ